MKMTKRCSYCDSEFDAALEECPFCGGRAAEHVCANCGVKYSGVACPRCGVRYDDEGQKCPKCGARMFKRQCATCGYTPDLAKAAAQTAKKAGTGAASLAGTILLMIVGFVFPFVSNIFFFFNRNYGKVVRWIATAYSLIYAAAMLHYPSSMAEMPADQAIQAGDEKTYFAFGAVTLGTLLVGWFVVWRRSKAQD